MIKFTILLRRNPETTHQQFVDYHKHKHAPLFTSLPEVKQHVRRYVQVHATGESMPGLPDSGIDGSTELWFDDVAGLERSSRRRRTWRPFVPTKRSSSTCTPASSCLAWKIL